MNSSNYISVLVNFIIFVLLQVFIFENFILYNTAFCFFYIGFILFLSFETDHLVYLFIALALGLTIDIFNDSLGVHASACVAIAFLRPYWLSIVTPRGGYESITTPNVKVLGFQWFLSYAFPLIFMHHLLLFFVEAGNFYYFFNKLWKIFSSSLLTFIILVIYQYIFFRRVRML